MSENTLATDPQFVELVRYAAPILAGTSALTINFSTPPVQDDKSNHTITVGLAAKNRSGRAFIWIDPEIADDDFFSTLLHELAHVKLHVKDLPYCNDEYINAAPKSQPLVYDRFYLKREAEVKQQMRVWLEWVEAHGHEVQEAVKYINVSSYHLILSALKHYQERRPVLAHKIVSPDFLRELSRTRNDQR